MPVLGSHPLLHTAHVYDDQRGSVRVYAPLRRLASFSTARHVVDVLANPGRVRRAAWDHSLTVGSLTLAIVRK